MLEESSSFLSSENKATSLKLDNCSQLSFLVSIPVPNSAQKRKSA